MFRRCDQIRSESLAACHREVKKRLPVKVFLIPRPMVPAKAKFVLVTQPVEREGKTSARLGGFRSIRERRKGQDDHTSIRRLLRVTKNPGRKFSTEATKLKVQILGNNLIRKNLQLLLAHGDLCGQHPQAFQIMRYTDHQHMTKILSQKKLRFAAILNILNGSINDECDMEYVPVFVDESSHSFRTK